MPSAPTASSMPRLFEALGLSPERVRAEVMASDPDPATLAGLAYWLPTKEDLAQAATARPLVPEASSRHGTVAADAVAPRFVESDPAPRAPDVGERQAGGDRRTGMVRWPTSLCGARTRVSGLAVIGLIGVLIAAAALFGLRLWRAQAAATPVPVSMTGKMTGTESGDGVVARATPSFGASTSAPKSAAAPGGAATGAAEVVVDVVGQVRRPGVVRLPPGARVIDALAKAGGAAPGADVAAINMARVVVDGEQIRVPRPGEATAAPSGGSAGAANSGANSAGAAGSGGGLINLNTADLSALDGLPGVGPVLAQRILDWRTENGKFSSVDDLGEVSGIGEKLLAQIKPRATV